MFTACTHTHDSGETCKSPAVRGTALCFHHTPHEKIERQWPHESEPFELPKIHSKSSIIVAISEVLERMAQRRIKRSEANTYLHGFALSVRIMNDLDRETAEYAAGFNDAQSVAPTESETTSEAIQQTLDEIAESLGVEPPSLEEKQNLQASMPNGTPERALNHWIKTGRIRPIRPAGGITPATGAAWVGNNKHRTHRADDKLCNNGMASAMPPMAIHQSRASAPGQIQITANAPSPSNHPIHS